MRNIIILMLLCNILFAKNVSKDSIHIESINAFSELRNCVNNDSKACEKLLNAGVRSVNECEIHECALIGEVLIATNKDELAIEYLKKACLSRVLSACKNLGIAFENLNNINNAKAYYNDGCKFNDVLSCHNLGLLYAKKLDNENLAMQSFKISCDLFYSKSCYNLAVLYAKNTQNSNKSKAKYYFDKACDLGLNAGCNALKDFTNIQMPSLQKQRGLYIKSF
ncbi:sel1 repeat family protein [Helicobacter saguini]|uniref:Beta-lactamase n=1 Tax=Helicobacter saguini TaxID=1548018 RepID=A0A347VJQ8_9HELI|nr:sel1 repeat family protein [Helicobacter saguini]MWV63188.1 sel1 repeat family protein [Helicobacter saguini]MWV66142.1 sel1 repeat family protein [Helicobacter saguini]MWV68492.1 sel1 repeat family protein [Helicobacter saguini]MWV71954.1 sel1 repeat family protein [Helicobacter saguini]TLD95962.1 sel1 repeat family protein [Helicobacter saguini]